MTSSNGHYNVGGVLLPRPFKVPGYPVLPAVFIAT